MEDQKMFRLHMGALAPSIADQLKQQKLIADNESISRFQKISDSITMLKFHGYLSDSQAQKASQKLANQIGKSIKIK